MLGCISMTNTIRDNEAITPIYSALVRPCLCSVLVPATQNRCGQAGEGSSHKADQIWRLSFYRKSHKADGGNGYKVLQGRFWLYTKGKVFTWGQSAIRTVSSEKWWVPQCWTLLRLRWTDCWAILSSPCFCQERLEQMILEAPSNWHSMILWFQRTKIFKNFFYIYIQIMYKIRYTLLQYM